MSKKMKKYELELATSTARRVMADFEKQVNNVFAKKESASDSNERAYSTVIGYLSGVIIVQNALIKMRNKAKETLMTTEVELQKAKIKDKPKPINLN